MIKEVEELKTVMCALMVIITIATLIAGIIIGMVATMILKKNAYKVKIIMPSGVIVEEKEFKDSKEVTDYLEDQKWDQAYRAKIVRISILKEGLYWPVNTFIRNI